MILRDEVSQLQAALETSNAASFEAQKRLAVEQAAMQHEREEMKLKEKMQAPPRRRSHVCQ